MKKSFAVKQFVRLVCGGGLLGLISLSLVGVGFSSWLISSKDSPSRDTPLDSIGADGEFSDINQYLNIDSVDTSDFIYNSTFGFLGPNGEVISDHKGTLIFYGSFSVDKPFGSYLFFFDYFEDELLLGRRNGCFCFRTLCVGS